jgi:uncharacterized integral membrane protein (TIGR00698 family)
MVHAVTLPGTAPSRLDAAVGVVPGLALCVGITVAATALQGVEVAILGRAWLESLVLAILLGVVVRTLWTPGRRWTAGIGFSAKILLEVAIVLLGATFSARMIAGAGLGLFAGVVGIVFLAIGVSYGLGRLFGLPHRWAVLIACGNAICGNSAIAAVAPVIGADGEDVAASIAFTAVLGVGVVLGLPLLAVAWGMTPRAFGVLAGLTVYAVPQVLAATAPISSISAHIGALVKLVRVLMLGPVVLILSLLDHRDRAEPAPASPAVSAGDRPVRGRAPLHQLVPWFIVGFLLLIAARSYGVIPAPWIGPAGQAAGGLTVVSMAALGLGVDLRMIARAGPRASAVVTLSLLALGGAALALIQLLRIGCPSCL